MKQKECETRENEKFIIEFACPMNYDVQSLKKELDTLKSLVDVEVRIRNIYGFGVQLGSLKNLSKCIEDGLTTVSHEKGTVMLLNSWTAKWCGVECEGPMAHIQEMLTKNAQDWG